MVFFTSTMGIPPSSGHDDFLPPATSMSEELITVALVTGLFLTILEHLQRPRQKTRAR